MHDQRRVQDAAPLHSDSTAALPSLPHNIKHTDTMNTSQPLPAAAPPPPTMENAFHVSVAPITQPLQAGPPVDVILIVSIGPILFSNPAAQTSRPSIYDKYFRMGCCSLSAAAARVMHVCRIPHSHQGLADRALRACSRRCAPNAMFSRHIHKQLRHVVERWFGPH